MIYLPPSGRRGIEVLLLVIVGSFGACGGASEEELRGELLSFVAASNACQATDECVSAFISCPLGCYAAVNQEHQAAVEAKAQELVKQRSGGSTECECTGEKPVECVEGRCAEVAP